MTGRLRLIRLSHRFDWLDIVFALAVITLGVGFYYLAPMANRLPAPAMSRTSSQSFLSSGAPTNAPGAARNVGQGVQGGERD